MAQTKLGDNVVNTNGDLPKVGTKLSAFTLVNTDRQEVNSSEYSGKKIVLNIFPSIDTGICSASVREFNKRAASFSNTVVLCISKDLPFAHKRFCGAEGIDKVVSLSDYRAQGFAKSYGVEMIDGNMKGLFARVVIVADESGTIKHVELVPAIGQEPNYDAAVKAL
ncbi:MAG: thiol peroxidase [Flammeovirgaceae bacterium]|nr:thiol peroxidase [Flammeovirgaceae bacterium]